MHRLKPISLNKITSYKALQVIRQQLIEVMSLAVTAKSLCKMTQRSRKRFRRRVKMAIAAGQTARRQAHTKYNAAIQRRQKARSQIEHLQIIVNGETEERERRRMEFEKRCVEEQKQNQKKRIKLKAMALEFMELDQRARDVREKKQRVMQELAQVEKEYKQQCQQTQILQKQIDRIKLASIEIAQRQQFLIQDREQMSAQVQNIIGNIRVYLRIKPYSSTQKLRDLQLLQNQQFFQIQNNSIKFTLPKNQKSDNYRREYNFMFEDIFNENSTQNNVFDEFDRLIESVLLGKNVCIIAYGQTGSGKTHTMQGTKQNPGIIPRSLRKLFNEILDAEREAWEYEILVECVEIYNEDVRQLLPNKENRVNSIEQIEKLIIQCNSNRSVAQTSCNYRSSRSHLIFTIKLCATNQFQGIKRTSYLSLVDLAGSERVDMSNVQGDRLKQTKYINGSLTQLGLVIESLAQKRTHIPFRNSKLTAVLEPILSGDSRTVMMVCVSPLLGSWNQTLSSLAFGEKVKKVTAVTTMEIGDDGESSDDWDE